MFYTVRKYLFIFLFVFLFLQKNINADTSLKKLLESQGESLNKDVISKVISAVKCSKYHGIEHNNILTIIDYSLPSNKKRFWVFDLNNNKLLSHTHVSHGITSGALFTEKFSNISNTKSGSLGVFKTGESYRGREGLSMRLLGLEEGFNDNAKKRFIVMHGGWYMSDKFINKYGRPGRSWGCPAVPSNVKNGIINTIKDGSLMVIYYPSDKWFENSKFLNCANKNLDTNINKKYFDLEPTLVENAKRDEILYFDLNGNNIREREDPVITLSADDYAKIFNSNPPLFRMIRRQINNKEYIVLSKDEFDKLIQQNNKHSLSKLKFIIPVLVKVRGRVRTKMQIIKYDKIKNIISQDFLNENTNEPISGYLFDFNNTESIKIKPTNEFIRWIGL